MNENGLMVAGVM